MLGDNLSYLIIDPTSNLAAAVDPVEPEKTLTKAKELGVEVAMVLTTHSHWDHDGGCVCLPSPVGACQLTILSYA
jgi:hydroxyacylglutathione hydrolase